MKRLISFSVFLLLIVIAAWARSRALTISTPSTTVTAQASKP
jgi:hypothetical protein